MARKNLAPKTKPVFTHGGAPAERNIGAVNQLRRSVMSCLLWEDTFYEDGVSIADRIAGYAKQVSAEDLAAVAVEARNQHNLRHVPLLLLNTLTKTAAGRPDGLVRKTMAQTIKRADELGEFMMLYADGRYKKNADGSLGDRQFSLSGQVKKGMVDCLKNFDEYQLAKYNRDGAWKIRDVMFITHAKPTNDELYKKLAEDELNTPDTWETALSAGADKKETFERLLRDGKLGYMALLRNLRNMEQSGVDTKLVNDALRARKGAQRVLPFRFTAAARHAPKFERAIDDALCATIESMPRLPGKTLVLVDVSVSMQAKLSAKSELSRMDAAATLASMINADDLSTYSFSNNLVRCKARRGMAGVEDILKSQSHNGTALHEACRKAASLEPEFDRMIVITDEQATGRGVLPTLRDGQKAYMINCASYQNGLGYKNGWTHVDGFSEAVLKYIFAVEGLDPAFA